MGCSASCNSCKKRKNTIATHPIDAVQVHDPESQTEMHDESQTDLKNTENIAPSEEKPEQFLLLPPKVQVVDSSNSPLSSVTNTPLSSVTNSAFLAEEAKFGSTASLNSTYSLENSDMDSITKKEYKSKREAKKAKQKKRKQKDFLSHVPEIDADIQYRFTFFVVGEAAEKLVEAACCSDEAQSLPDKTSSTPFISEVPSEEGDLSVPNINRSFISEEQSSANFLSEESRGSELRVSYQTQGSGGDDEEARPRNSANKYPRLHRCMCPVPYPWGRLKVGESCKYAKLAFQTLSFDDSIPSAKSSLEAASSALVFVICVDPAQDAPSLEDQLQSLLAVLKKRRKTPRDLRPVWAVILYQCDTRSETNCEGEALEEGWETWSKQLEEFEQAHGALWRFGSMNWQDAEKLYQTFAKIASQRIYTSHNPESECVSPMVSEWPDDATSHSTPPMYGAEQDDVDESESMPVYGAERETTSDSSFTGILPHAIR